MAADYTPPIVLASLARRRKLLGLLVEEFAVVPQEEGEVRVPADVLALAERKAGAYGIQARAAALVGRIEGDFYNVVGLPLCALWRILWEMGWRPKGS